MVQSQTPSRQWDQARQDYEREGYAIFRNVLDADLIKEASGHIAWLMEKNPGTRPEHLGHKLVADDPFWLRLVADDRLLDVAQQFVGPNIALFASHYIVKPPFDGQAVLWHQDGSYWPLDPMEVVTLWLAIDDATADNGCLRVIPGTHRMDLQKLRRRTDVANVLSSEIAAADVVDESKALDIVLKAGDVEVHHPNIIHGSNPNTSPRRRAGLTIRYIPTSTRVTDTSWPCVFLLRGEPVKGVKGVNEYRTRPRFVKGESFPFRGSEAWA